MFRLSKAQKRWWEFLAVMVEREVRIKYKNTFLGFGWIIINPLLQMLVFGVIFQFILKNKIDNYFLFIFAGLSLWNYFSFTVTRCTTVMVTQRALIQKANFPREIIVLSVVVSNLIQLFLSAVLCLIGLALGPHIFLIKNWGEILVVLLWITILTSGLSLGLAAVNVRHRDVNFIVAAAMSLWFYATPVVYELKMLPASLGNYFYINPLTGIVELFRHAVMGVEPFNWGWCGGSFVISVVVLIGGVLIFNSMEPWFDDWV